MKNRNSIRTVFQLFLFTSMIAFYSGVSLANDDGASPFVEQKLVDGPVPTEDEINTLADELAVEYSEFMIESFKQMSAFYNADEAQKSTMLTGQDTTMLLNFNKFLNESCTTEFDNDDQLISSRCSLGPWIWLSHPSYENIKVKLYRHNLQGDIRDVDHSFPSQIIISREDERYKSFKENSREQLKVWTSNYGINVKIEPLDATCTVILGEQRPYLFEEHTLTSECAAALRESVAVLKKLNAGL